MSDGLEVNCWCGYEGSESGHPPHPVSDAEDCRARPGYYTDGLPRRVSDEIVKQATKTYRIARTDSGQFGPGMPPFDAMHCALSSVLPDIERPLREEIRDLKAIRRVGAATITGLEVMLVERDKEIERLNSARDSLALSLSAADTKLAERDKEIERLTRENDALRQRNELEFRVAEHKIAKRNQEIGYRKGLLRDEFQRAEKAEADLVEARERMDWAARYFKRVEGERDEARAKLAECLLSKVEIEALLARTQWFGSSGHPPDSPLGRARNRLEKMRDEAKPVEPADVEPVPQEFWHQEEKGWGTR